MATVYKIEVEVVSDWVNYDEETIKNIVRNQIDSFVDPDVPNMLRSTVEVIDRT